MKCSPSRVATVAMLTLIASQASAYTVGYNGNVFNFGPGPGESNYFSVNDWQYSGATSASFDSGLFTSSLSPPCAQYDQGLCIAYYPAGYGQFSNVLDLSRGVLHVSASTGGAYGSAAAGADLEDILTFSLPDGLSSALITASLSVMGTGTDCPRTTGYTTVALTDSHGSVSTGSNGLVCTSDFFGESYSVQRSVANGDVMTVFANLYARVVVNGEADWNSAFSLDVPAYLTLSMPAGVTFTSQSGVFLTTAVVPAPPTVWLLATALGLIGWKSRKILT